MRPPFGDWLEARRLERGWSLNTMATLIGVPQETYRSWASGRYLPSVGKLSQIATVLDAPLVDVLVAYLGLTADDLRGALERMTEPPQNTQ